VGLKILSRPLMDSFSVGRRQKYYDKIVRGLLIICFCFHILVVALDGNTPIFIQCSTSIPVVVIWLPVAVKHSRKSQ
jgi:hypothetical protein